MNNKKIIPMMPENTRVSEGMKQAPMLAEPIIVPLCPKCNKAPLRCPFPTNCGMENL